MQRSPLWVKSFVGSDSFLLTQSTGSPKVRFRPDQSAVSWPSLAQIGAACLFDSVRPRDVSKDAVELSQAIKHVRDRPVAVAVCEKSPRAQGPRGRRPDSRS